MTQTEAAKVILNYYRIYDSDTEDEKYYLRVEEATRVCLERFSQPALQRDPLVSLFLLYLSLRESSFMLSELDLDDISDGLDEQIAKVDANVRAVISRLTHENILNDEQYNEEFVDSFPDCPPPSNSKITNIIEAKRRKIIQ